VRPVMLLNGGGELFSVVARLGHGGLEVYAG
jgi:hypothetical protein